MMKLSTKGRYGVRLMLDLALHREEVPITLKEISKRQEISEKYLWHLITPLKTAGLIQSIRGSKGGYALAKSLTEISLKQIVNVLEGSLSLVECVEKPSLCTRSNACVARDVWKDVADKISTTLESITLKDIVESHRIKSGGSFTYHI